MCCRFYSDETTQKDIVGLVDGYDKGIDWLREGDVHPGDKATVIIKGSNGLFAGDMRFGMNGSKNTADKKAPALLINARAETVREKKSFAESVAERRCVIPAKKVLRMGQGQEQGGVFARQGKIRLPCRHLPRLRFRDPYYGGKQLHEAGTRPHAAHSSPRPDRALAYRCRKDRRDLITDPGRIVCLPGIRAAEPILKKQTNTRRSRETGSFFACNYRKKRYNECKECKEYKEAPLFMEIATVTSKGQVTIPIAVRRFLGINTGDKILFQEEGDKVIMLNASRKLDMSKLVFAVEPASTMEAVAEETDFGWTEDVINGKKKVEL